MVLILWQKPSNHDLLLFMSCLWRKRGILPIGRMKIKIHSWNGKETKCEVYWCLYQWRMRQSFCTGLREREVETEEMVASSGYEEFDMEPSGDESLTSCDLECTYPRQNSKENWKLPSPLAWTSKTKLINSNANPLQLRQILCTSLLPSYHRLSPSHSPGSLTLTSLCRHRSLGGFTGNPDFRDFFQF